MRRVDETAFLYQQELRFGTFESVSAEDWRPIGRVRGKDARHAYSS